MKLLLLALLIPSVALAQPGRRLSHSGGSGRAVMVRPEKKQLEQKEEPRARPSLSETEEEHPRRVYLTRSGSGSAASHVVRRKARSEKSATE